MFTKRWHARYGYKDVLSISLPLVISMGSTTIMQFTDRIFLSNYSLEAIAAVLPAGITAFLFQSFPVGVVSYVGVFVAQYTGRNMHHKVGPSLWQGIFFSLASAVVFILLALSAEKLFSLAGHPPEIVELEIVYFRIIMLGSIFNLYEVTTSSFYSGRGLTRVVMIINLIGMAINVPLDYCMIYGIGPFPVMGIRGAAYATMIAYISMCAMYSALIFTPKNDRLFNVFKGMRIEKDLFKRMMKFGIPGGVQFFLDIFAVTFFVFMVGRLGKVALTASNIAFSIDTLAFLPSIGFSIGLSIMAGQAIGAKNWDHAVFATNTTLRINLFYMVVVSTCFLLFPGQLMNLFRPDSIPAAEFAPIYETGIMLLRFVAFYTFLDAICLTYTGLLKGAGDSQFIMITMSISSMLFMILPVYLSVEVFHWGLWELWAILFIYILILAVVFFIRFTRGKWKNIEVIESREF